MNNLGSLANIFEQIFNLSGIAFVVFINKYSKVLMKLKSPDSVDLQSQIEGLVCFAEELRLPFKKHDRKIN